MKLARLGPLALLALVGCSARAEPLEADLVVASAGPASPVAAGEHCVLRMQPAWRSGEAPAPFPCGAGSSQKGARRCCQRRNTGGLRRAPHVDCVSRCY